MRNIKRIREGQRLTYVELVERLASIGRPIPILGLRRIERGERRVDLDDLLALAKALRVNPVDLMVPADLADEEPYSVAPEVPTTAATARNWIGGIWFLEDPETPLEFAEAIRFMPKARAEELAHKWFSSRSVPTNGKLAALRRPDDRITDEFLIHLTAVYLELAAQKRAPAPVIAEQTGAPVRTVHRWIYEARKRGHLPPGHRGRVA